MTNRRRRKAAALAALATALVAVAIAARSPAVRASFSAAYHAFREPSRLRGEAEECPDLDRRAPIELEEPEISSDLEPVTEADLEDAGASTLATLTQPDLPIPISRRAMHFVAYFAADADGRRAFTERYRRGGRYRRTIEQALRDADLPEDLVWLVAIESGFNPQAMSPKGAAGLFQFMPETGSRYGLAQTEAVDERKSIPKSAAAGVALLRDLFGLYHQWDLALAAYNFGREGVDDAIQRLKARRGPREAAAPIALKDLAEAHLVPKETANFVPQIQAFAIVAANRGRFDLDALDVAAPFELGEIAVPASTHLVTIARAASVELETVRDYNPDLLSDRVPPSGDTIVNIPADRVERARAALPLLLAREARIDASAAPPTSAKGSAPPAVSAAPEASAPRPPASAAPSDRPPAIDRWTLANGVAFERSGPETSADVTISARVELASARAPATPLRSFDTEAVRVSSKDLESGLGRAADRVSSLVTGDAASELRTRASATRRRELEKTPYGAAWIALGDALFPAGHALQGTALGAPLQPFAPVVFANAPAEDALHVFVNLSGADRAKAEPLSARAFGAMFGGGAAVPPHPREERLEVSDRVPSPRVLVGWIGPGQADAATLRLAIVLLAQGNIGRASRALAVTRHIAAQVRGSLDLGERASVAAIEAVPAVPHDAVETLNALDEAIAGFAADGPTLYELGAAKTIVRDRLIREKLDPAMRGESKAARARIDAVMHAAEEATPSDVRETVKKVFTRDHRVIVTTEPGATKGSAGSP